MVNKGVAILTNNSSNDDQGTRAEICVAKDNLHRHNQTLKDNVFTTNSSNKRLTPTKEIEVLNLQFLFNNI